METKSATEDTYSYELYTLYREMLDSLHNLKNGILITLYVLRGRDAESEIIFRYEKSGEILWSAEKSAQREVHGGTQERVLSV